MEESEQPTYVTKPFLPPLEELEPYLKEIWLSHTLTNNGPFHEKLEQDLCEYLGVNNICLFTNGTLALMTALQALRITGEVITTPYSFVATTHSLWWNKIKPVFADIEQDYFNLDPDKVEAAITSQTTAIMPVHVYGNPCNHERFQEIANKYRLKLIYDAAHAFGVKINGSSVLNLGDLSILSFHATKVFNTFEGGAIICQDQATKKHIESLKNFGFINETTVVTPGINAKMNEVQAAMGLLQLNYIEGAIEKRKQITDRYREGLKDIFGISYMRDIQGVKHNYSYFPIMVEKERYGNTRDKLYELLKQHNIYGRRYFYPLISQFSTYRGLDSAKPGKMPIAEKVAQEVICLPIYPDLSLDLVNKICDLTRCGLATF